jgi:hypothetical protein
MRTATTSIFTAAVLAVSSLTFAADRGGGNNGSHEGRNDGGRTSHSMQRDRNDIDDQERCGRNEWGGPLWGEGQGNQW